MRQALPQQASLDDAPRADGIVGLKALKGIYKRRSIIGALEVMHAEMGDVFQLTVPGFNPVVLVGPEASRFVLVSARDDLRWRMEREPITLLLNHGVLVEDQSEHDTIRKAMHPPLHRRMLENHISAMWRNADQIITTWADHTTYDMLPEMRKIALLVLTETLFGVDFAPEMAELWPGILQAVHYISPGPWVLWRGLSKVGYDKNLRMIDDYLYRIIAARRENPGREDDLLGALIHNPAMTDDLIRDQLMTMLIAGHDTSTANLAWTLHLLGKHPQAMIRAQEEVRRVLGDEPPRFENLRELTYLSQVIDESLRLFPPIHLGSRVAATDLKFKGYHIPEGTRVLYSIYLTHRHPEYWPNPNTFDPDRFAPGQKRPTPYTYLPFGGGPRNCIGAAFATVEAKVVLARILQQTQLHYQGDAVRPYMGATLEPRPGVRMTTIRR